MDHNKLQIKVVLEFSGRIPIEYRKELAKRLVNFFWSKETKEWTAFVEKNNFPVKNGEEITVVIGERR